MAQPNPSWFEHVDLMQAAIVALIMIVGWFAIQTLRKINENQIELFNRLHSLENEFHILKGEHQAIAGRCKE